MNKKLDLKVGDVVTGMFISDIKEELGSSIINQRETITKITEDGEGYSLIETNYTKTLAKDIARDNKKIEDPSQKINTDWCVNHSNNSIKVITPLEESPDLSSINGKITKNFVEFEHMEMPKDLFESLKQFVQYLEGRDILEILDVENEVLLTISGIEFKPSMLKSILK